MEWNSDPNQVPTKDKKFIFLDTMQDGELQIHFNYLTN